jgi:hypothetical protein
VILIALLAAVVQAAEAPSPIRVHFVGNSFTFGNDLPGLVAELGRSLDPPVRLEVGMTARDGMTLEQHWREGDIVRRLREEDWDILVLQEQGSRPITDPDRMEHSVRRFAAAARDAGAEVILFQTWARVGQPETDIPRAATYRRLADAVGARLAPVGDAWGRARAELPAVVLHADDGVHANRAGAYLSAAVLLGVIAGRSPEGALASTSGEPDSAAALRTLAWRAITANTRRAPGSRAPSPAQRAHER